MAHICFYRAMILCTIWFDSFSIVLYVSELCCAFMFICVKDKREVWGHVTAFRVTVATRFQGFLKGNLILGPAYEMI